MSPREAARTALFVLVPLCGALSCAEGNAPQSRSVTSAAPPTVEVSSSAAPPATPPAHSTSTALDAPLRGFPRGTSARAVGDALRSLGWTPVGSREGSVKGTRTTTVVATREALRAEVKILEGYPQGLADMLELKGSAQGFAEMTMITVLVKDDPAETDALYRALMGSAPERHGSGVGNRAE